MGQRGRIVMVDIGGVSLPMHPLTVPSEAELAMLQTAKYESNAHASGWLLRRFGSVRSLVAVAAAIFAYDIASVFLFR